MLQRPIQHLGGSQEPEASERTREMLPYPGSKTFYFERSR